MMTKLLLTLFGSLLMALPLAAQTVENIGAAYDGTNVVIFYDLKGTTDGQEYKVEIFCSFNNYVLPLVYVTGDVGPSIVPGTKKQVKWNASIELPDGYDGELSFRVIATLTKSPWQIVAPTNKTSLKRGKAYTVKWFGANSSAVSQLQLLSQDTVLVAGLTMGADLGEFDWTPDIKLKPGTYILRLSSPGGGKKTTESFPFKIKRKVPWGIKLLPLLPVAALVAYLAQPKDLPLPSSPYK